MRPLRGPTPARRWARSAEPECSSFPPVCSPPEKENRIERRGGKRGRFTIGNADRSVPPSVFEFWVNVKNGRKKRETEREKERRSVIKYTAGEAAVTAEHLACATACNHHVLSILRSVIARVMFSSFAVFSSALIQCVYPTCTQSGD